MGHSRNCGSSERPRFSVNSPALVSAVWFIEGAIAHSMKPATCRPLSFRRNRNSLYGSKRVLLMLAAAILRSGTVTFVGQPTRAVLLRASRRPLVNARQVSDTLAVLDQV